jgi:hypothetical protein
VHYPPNCKRRLIFLDYVFQKNVQGDERRLALKFRLYAVHEFVVLMERMKVIVAVALISLGIDEGLARRAL